MSMSESTMNGYGVIGSKINEIKLKDINKWISDNDLDPFYIYVGDEDDYYNDDTDMTLKDYVEETDESQLDIMINIIEEVCKINGIKKIDFDMGQDSDGDCYILYTPRYPWNNMDRSLTPEDIDYVLKLTFKACGVILDDRDIDYQTAYFWG